LQRLPVDFRKATGDIVDIVADLEDASPPDGVDMRELSDRVWEHVGVSGHWDPCERESLRQRRWVAVEGRTYGLWSYSSLGLEHFALSVFAGGLEYVHCYSNYDLHHYIGHAGATAEQFALWDSMRWAEREAVLEVYRERVQATPNRARAYWELGLMVWRFGFLQYPGSPWEAVSSLERATALAPRDVRAQGLLGFIHLTRGEIEPALERFQRAVDLDQRDPTFVYCAGLAAGAGGDAEAAERLDQMARQRAKPRERNFRPSHNPATEYQFMLLKASERLRQRVEGIAPLSDKQRAWSDRADVQVDPQLVPEPLRALVPHARKWGIGDDVSRAYFVERASRKEKAALRKALAPHLDAVNAWLDTSPAEKFTNEQTALLYLLEAFEEMGA
jgi:tetratricopeptide (TPR) repeat protein